MQALVRGRGGLRAMPGAGALLTGTARGAPGGASRDRLVHPRGPAGGERLRAEKRDKPAFKGYYVPAAGEAYKYVLCTSVNSEIVHGMPNPKRVLKSGDLVSKDTGGKLDGYYGDSAITVPIGEVSEETKKLLQVTQESLDLAIDRVRSGNR